MDTHIFSFIYLIIFYIRKDKNKIYMPNNQSSYGWQKDQLKGRDIEIIHIHNFENNHKNTKSISQKRNKLTHKIDRFTVTCRM